MPFKSEAQRRKFGELVSQGKMSQATFNEWNSDTPTALPERLGNKRNRAPRSLDDLRAMGRKKSAL